MRHYAGKLSRDIEGIDAHALNVLLNYDYPGNIRELQNIMERAVTLCAKEWITKDVLPYHMQDATITKAAEELDIPDEGIDLEGLVEQLERTMIKKALDKSNGVKKEAAKLLGISFRAMRYRLEKYDMQDE